MEIGLVDKVISYSPKDIDGNFYKKNKKTLKHERGNGYWLWKPYFIQKTLSLLKDGDYLFYCDSGSYFINSVKPLIDICEENSQNIIPFNSYGKEREYTKRDVFVALNCDIPKYTESRQRMGGFILIKKSKFSTIFIEEFLRYSQDFNLISDSKNTLGLDNYNGFIEHRHDQSIFSLLTKKYELKEFRDPSQYGKCVISEYENSQYKQVIEITRKRNYSFIMKLGRYPKYFTRKLSPLKKG